MNGHGMVENFILAQAQAHFARRREKLGSITSAQHASARQAEVRKICLETIGARPECGPLNVQYIQTLERDDYNVRILTYQSLTGVVATANLYLPVNRPAPVPGVLCIPGQWPEGKARGEFQRLARLLARSGMAVLLIDLVGQGERLEYYDSTLRRSWVGKEVQDEWSQLGNPMLLAGLHLESVLAFDAARGIDLLIEHGGIDSKRLGLHCSPGAESLGLLLCSLDERLAAASLAGDNLSREALGGGAEQNLLDAIPHGVVPLDLLVPFAPRPLLLSYSAEKGAEERNAVLAELRHWYGLLGKSDAVVAVEIQGAALSRDGQSRMRTAEFFARRFGLPEDRAREVESPPEAAETLYATETGQLSNSLNTTSVFAWQKNAASVLPPPRVVPRDAQSAKTLQAEIRESFKPFLRLPQPSAEVENRVESHSNLLNFMVEKGRLEIEEGLYVPYSFFALPEAEGSGSRRAVPTVLTLHERGIAGVSNQPSWMAGFADAGMNVMAIDVCGIGETRLQTAQETRMQPAREALEAAYDSLLCGPESQWARRALNAGLSLFGLRVFSVLRTLSYLRTRPEVQTGGVSVVGVGRGGLWGLYAAALDGEVSRVALLRSLATYKCLVEHRRHNHHFSLYLPGCLKEFDLPQVAACVAPRPLTLINSINQRKDRCEVAALQQDYALTGSVYKVCAAAGKFRITQTDSAPQTLKAVKQALGAE